jgi:hypothetical protein
LWFLVQSLTGQSRAGPVTIYYCLICDSLKLEGQVLVLIIFPRNRVTMFQQNFLLVTSRHGQHRKHLSQSSSIVATIAYQRQLFTQLLPSNGWSCGCLLTCCFLAPAVYVITLKILLSVYDCVYLMYQNKKFRLNGTKLRLSHGFLRGGDIATASIRCYVYGIS